MQDPSSALYRMHNLGIPPLIPPLRKYSPFLNILHSTGHVCLTGYQLTPQPLFSFSKPIYKARLYLLQHTSSCSPSKRNLSCASTHTFTSSFKNKSLPPFCYVCVGDQTTIAKAKKFSPGNTTS